MMAMAMRRPEDPAATPDFWRSSGYRMVEVDAERRLRPTDDFLRAFLLRPEILPVAESCDAELTLHEALLTEPRLAVAAARLTELADPDTRANYQTWLGFRDHLLAQPSLEGAYLDLVRRGTAGVPPLFLDQLVHVIVRHILRDCMDPLRLRAAELLFREQKVTIQDGRVMLADDETVEMQAAAAGRLGLAPEASLARLLDPSDPPLRSVELDVLDEANAGLYWARSDRFDTVLDLSFTRPGLDALCRVLEAWIQHFTAAVVAIQPVQQIRDERWVWHIGLDAEASAILNDLWEGRTVEDGRRAQLLSLFRLDFRDPDDMLARVRGRPVYLGLAMTGAGQLKVKPQNLLVNLPLAGTI
jgi:Family of unknown function (DUF6352)